MRYGVLADIHGNLHALRAAVSRLQAEGVDRWVCAGDVVGYGAHPNECVAVLAELGAACVAGNHDLLAMGALALDRSGSLARGTTPWTRKALTTESRRYLRDLPLTWQDENLLVAHGSLTDPEEYVTRRQQVVQSLREAALRAPGTVGVVLGHTHRSAAWDAGGRARSIRYGRSQVLTSDGGVLVNPGSVGQSRYAERTPHARCMLWDVSASTMVFFREPYDVAGAARALRRAGLPPSCLHLRPGRGRSLARRAQRRLLQAVR